MDGAVGESITCYSEVVEILLTFREPGGHSASLWAVFVVVSKLNANMILGCPTLDGLSFATGQDSVELRAFDMVLPAIASRNGLSGSTTIAFFEEAVEVHPE